MSAPKEISFTLKADEPMEIWLYAEYRHVGGRNPCSAMMKELAFAQMRKYPIPEAERARLEKRYQDEVVGPKAVQPEGFQDDSGGDAA